MRSVPGLKKVGDKTGHKGRTEKFGETATNQCACMALVAIVSYIIKEVSSWDQTYLDVFF